MILSPTLSQPLLRNKNHSATTVVQRVISDISLGFHENVIIAMRLIMLLLPCVL